MALASIRLKVTPRASLRMKVAPHLGLQGPAGDDGEGVPAGGTTGQVLRKLSGVDFSTAWETLVKDDVGLGNVDNTSDADKPISTLTQAALDSKQDEDDDLTALSGIGVTAAGIALLNDADAAAQRATLGLDAATQADQEAGTEAVQPVTPAVQHFHPSAAKFWCFFNGTGTIAVVASYNVTSLTDNNTGDYTINIATDFADTNWAAVATSNQYHISNDSNAAGTLRVSTYNITHAAADAARVTVAGFGDQ